MIITLLIIAYIANFFLNRWLFFKWSEKTKTLSVGYGIFVSLISLCGTIALLVLLLITYKIKIPNKIANFFTPKHLR